MSIKVIDKIELVKDAASLTPSDLISYIQVPTTGKAQVKLPTVASSDTLVAEATTQTLTNKTITVGTASRALVTNASGNIATSTVTSTEVGYLAGVTSAIQTQIDNLGVLEHPNSSNTFENNKYINLTSGTANTAIGVNTLATVSSGSYNTAYGQGAGVTLTTGGQNIVVGYAASTVAVDTDNSTVVGTSATGAANSIVIGHSAQSGANGIAIGGGSSLNTGISIGSSAFAKGTDSIAIGKQSFSNGVKNILIGSSTQDYDASNERNVIIGYDAGIPYATANQNYNVAIGNEAIIDGVGNTIIGANAVSQGDNNIILGRGAAHMGSNTLVIGSATYPITLGSTVIGSSSNSLRLYINGTQYFIPLYPI